MTDVAERRKRGHDKSGGWGETVRTVVYAVLIALVVRTFVIEPFNIPSGSMIPTLLVGDYLFVSKYSYGYSKHSFPFSLGFFSGRIFGRAPERGDVAVFKYPGDQGQGTNRTDYIKRVVGLPGDRIQVTNGILHINGKAVERIQTGDYVQGGAGGYRKGTLYTEVLPDGDKSGSKGGRRHDIIETSDNGLSDNTPEFLVPAGQYFVMGDNRDDSLDSRTQLQIRDATGALRLRDELGWYVPAENLVGRAEFIFFSHDPATAGWLEPWKWPEAIRFSRFFTAIH
jgi:signal peptidase I